MRTTYKLISVMIAAVFVLSAASMALSDNDSDGPGQSYVLGSGFVPVSDITGIPTSTPVGTLDLSSVAAVTPVTATNQNIEWTVKTVGTTNATISGSTLTTTASGNVTLTATVEDGLVNGIKEIAVGANYTVVLKEDGTLWAWGGNNYGQLGIGAANSLIPIQVGTDNDWKTIALGDGGYHTVALKTDGSLWTWGYNDHGQLGDNTTGNKNSPARIGTDNDWASITAGIDHTAAIKENGDLYIWGYNENGKLGLGSAAAVGSDVLTPTLLGGDWQAVAAGDFHTAGIKTDGSLWTWGSNTYGQLGIGTASDRNSPGRVGTDVDWETISAGGRFTTAFKNGNLYSWGMGGNGQLGQGSYPSYQNTPGLVSGSEEWVMVCAAGAHALAINTKGELWTWGWNSYGQLGFDGSSRNSPTKVGTDTDWAVVSGGGWHSAAAKTDGTVYVWGYNSYNILGTTLTTTYILAPTSVVATNIGVSQFIDFTKDFTIAVYVPTEITTTSLPYGVVGSAYGETLTADGSGTITWSLAHGSALPDGLSLSAIGDITGTTTTSGTFNFTVKAESTYSSDTRVLSIAVYIPPEITTASLPYGLVGSAYSETLTASGDGTITWALGGGTALPNGLSLSAAGAITGTPTASGTFTFGVVATSAYGYDPVTLSISVYIPPAITTASLPYGVVGSAYGETLTANGTAPITWSLAHGSALPDGLSLSAAGDITGTTTASGVFNFDVVATSTYGSDTRALSIAVYIPPAITTASLPYGVVGSAYSETLTADGTAPITWTVGLGTSLPAGLSLSAAGAITGTPTASGTFTFGAVASSAYGYDPVTLSITVYIPPAITTASLPYGVLGSAYSETLTASGDGTIAWSLAHGSALPDGLSISADGVISGTPTSGGVFEFDVTATSTYGSDTVTLSITVYAPPKITIPELMLKAPGELPDARVNEEYSAALNADGDGTITWTIESGELPDGLALSADGTISGTPTGPGIYEIVVKAENAYGSDTMLLRMLVEPAPDADLGTWAAVIAMSVLLITILVSSFIVRPQK